jgi:cell division protein FtsB
MRPEQNQMQNRRIGSCFLLALGASIVLFCGVGTATAIEVNQNYTELQKAVLDGKEIHMILDLSTCKVRGSDKAGPAVRGSMRFDGYMIQPDDTLYLLPRTSP